MKTFFTALALFAILILGACHKDQPTPTPAPVAKTALDSLPPATTTGANTFGCLVNGHAWIPYVTPSLFGSVEPINADYDTQLRRVSIVTLIENHTTSQGIEFYFLPVSQGQKTYKLTKFTAETSYGVYYDNIKQITCMTDSVNTGYVTLTRLDIGNGIVSGTFYFTAKASDGSIVKVTDGRFDCQGPF